MAEMHSERPGGQGVHGDEGEECMEAKEFKETFLKTEDEGGRED